LTNKIYKITRITNRDGTDRQEPDYIKRIGSKGKLYYLEEGSPLMFQYIERNNEPYDGMLRTSSVDHVTIEDNDMKHLIVTTKNSVFYLQEVNL
jgi:hypothetical protein